jgi:hypothetical protein
MNSNIRFCQVFLPEKLLGKPNMPNISSNISFFLILYFPKYSNNNDSDIYM